MSYQSVAANEPDPFLDTGSAAKVLNCSKSFLEKKRTTGGGPEFVKLGGLVRYRQSRLLAYAEGNTVSSTAGNRRRA